MHFICLSLFLLCGNSATLSSMERPRRQRKQIDYRYRIQDEHLNAVDTSFAPPKPKERSRNNQENLAPRNIQMPKLKMPKLKDPSKRSKSSNAAQKGKRGELLEENAPKKKTVEPRKRKPNVEPEQQPQAEPKKTKKPEEDRVKEKEAKKKRKLLTKKRKILVAPIVEKSVHVGKKRKKASSSKKVSAMQGLLDSPPPSSPPPVSPSPVKVRARSRSTKSTIVSDESEASFSSSEIMRSRSPTRSRSDRRFGEAEIMSDNSLRIIKAKDDAYDSLLAKYNQLAVQKRQENSKMLREIAQAGKSEEKSSEVLISYWKEEVAQLTARLEKTSNKMHDLMEEKCDLEDDLQEAREDLEEVTNERNTLQVQLSETQEAVKEEQEGTLSVAAKLREAEATKEIYKLLTATNIVRGDEQSSWNLKTVSRSMGREMSFSLVDNNDEISYVPKTIKLKKHPYPAYFREELVFKSDFTPQLMKNILESCFSKPVESSTTE